MRRRCACLRRRPSPPIHRARYDSAARTRSGLSVPPGHHGVVDDDGDDVIGWIREIVLDSPDPWALAHFWARLLGGTPVQWYPGWVTLEPAPHGQRLSFQGIRTREGQAAAPRAAPLVHFDVLVGDLAAAHERVIRSGATFTGEHVSPKPGPTGEPVAWRVYRDPAGHPFCLVTR